MGLLRKKLSFRPEGQGRAFGCWRLEAIKLKAERKKRYANIFSSVRIRNKYFMLSFYHEESGGRILISDY
jgi:hypothetical protein